MTAAELTLWEKIKAFNLNHEQSGFTFSDRLARENGWDKDYTLRVIEEYKKFIFLCCISSSGVTPSDPVDQAWHLHLTYTQSYWIDFCKNTLNQEIHHTPTKGGGHEAAKFNGFYTGSIKLYTDKFGVEPPADIWQDNKTRFSDVKFQRVNVGKYRLVRRSIVKTAFYALGIAAAIVIWSILPDYIHNFNAIQTPLLFAGFTIYVGISVYRDKRRQGGNGNGDGCSGGDSGYGDSDGNDTAHSGGHGHGDEHDGGHGCSSGCSGCSSSGCSGCGGGGD
jgi:hypothetical protein